MNFSPSKYFLRSPVLLAILGTIVFFPFESLGMETEEEKNPAHLIPANISLKEILEKNPLEESIDRIGNIMREGTEEERLFGATMLFPLVHNLTMLPKTTLKAAQIVATFGTEEQKKEACQVILTLSKNMDCSPHLLKNLDTVVIFAKDREQKTSACLFLLEILENPVSVIFLKQRLKIIDRMILYGNSDQKERGCSLLLLIMEKDENSFALKQRLEMIDTVISKGSLDQKERGYSLLLSIMEQEGNSLSLEERVGIITSVIQNGTSEQKLRGNALLLSIAHNPKTLFKATLKAAEIVALYGTEEQEKEGCDVLLTLSENRNCSLPDLLEILGRISSNGNPEQTTSALLRLFSMMEDPENSHYLEKCTKIIGRIIWKWTPDQQQLICSQFLLVAEKKENSFSPEKQLDMMETVIFHGTPEQKFRATALLLPLIHNPETLPETVLKSAQRIVFYGTEEQKKEASDVILTLSKGMDFSEDLVESLDHVVIWSPDPEQKTSAVVNLLAMMEDPTISFPLKQRIEVLRSINWQGTLDQRKHAGSLLLLTAEREKNDLSPEDLVDMIERAMGHGIPKGEARGIALLLPLINNPETLPSIAQKAATIVARVGKGKEKKEAYDAILTLSKGMDCSEDPVKSLEALFKSLGPIFWAGSSDQKMSAASSLFSILENPEASLSLENQLDITGRIVNHGTPDQIDRVSDLLFSSAENLENTLSLEDRLEIAKRFTNYSGTPQHQKERACRILMRILEDSAEKLPLEERIDAAKKIMEEGTDPQREKANHFLFPFLKDPKTPFEIFGRVADVFFTCGTQVQREEMENIFLSISEDANSLFSQEERAMLAGSVSFCSEVSTPAKKEQAEATYWRLIESSEMLPSVKSSLVTSILSSGKNSESQKKRAGVFLLSLLENIESPLSQEDRACVIKDILQEGLLDEKQRVHTLLLKDVENSQADLSLEEQIDIAQKIFKVGGTVDQKREICSVLWCLAQDSKTPQENCAKIAQILACYGEQEQKEGACAILLRVAQDPKTSPKSSREAAETVAWYGTQKQIEDACTFLLLMTEILDGSVSLNARRDIADRVIKRGTPDQNMAAGNFLWSLVENPPLSVSLKERMGAANSLLWHGDSDLHVKAQNFFLSLAKDTENDLTDRIEAAETIIDRSFLEIQKKGALDILFSIVQDPQIPSEDRLSAAKILVNSGTDVQKPLAHEILLGSVEDSKNERDIREIVMKGMNYYGKLLTDNQKERGCTLLLLLVKDFESYHSLENQIDALNLLIEYGELEQKKEASVLLQSISENPQTPPKNAMKAATILISQQGSDQRERAFTVLLTCTCQEGISLDDRIGAMYKVLTTNSSSDDQRKQAGLILKAIVDDPNVLSEFCVRAATILVEYGTAEQKTYGNFGLVSLIERSALSCPDRCWAAKALKISGTEEQKTGACTVLLSSVDGLGEGQDWQRKQALELIVDMGHFLQKIQAYILLAEINMTENRRMVLQGILSIYGEELGNVARAGQMVSLIRDLGAQEQTQWQGTIDNRINSYRVQNRRYQSNDDARYTERQREIDHLFAMEVHDYSRSPGQNGMRVHDAVLMFVSDELRAAEKSLPNFIKHGYEEAFEAVKDWIKDTIPSEKHEDSFSVIRRGLETVAGAKAALSEIFTFMKNFHPDEMVIWMNGFVGETLKAYWTKDSCPKGVEERMVTGLRSVDPKLDLLFEKAEKIQAAKMFMANCNFKEGPHEKNWLTQKLVDLGVTQTTKPHEVARLFKAFGETHIKTLKLEGEERNYLEQVGVFSGVLEDWYEDALKEGIVLLNRQKASHLNLSEMNRG